MIHRYLLGEDPFPFDLLYWNADSTRMPKAMHHFYLHQMYLENRLKEPGGVSLLEVPLDLSRIETPVYFLATRKIISPPGARCTPVLISRPVR